MNSPLNFSATNDTVGNWLASGGAFNIIQNTAGTLASLMSNGTTSTLVEFTGFVTVTNGQQFGVEHDDGLTLIIGGPPNPPRSRSSASVSVPRVSTSGAAAS